jgi:hypothetical protein
LIPEGTCVVFLGDGEFDGTELQETMNGYPFNAGQLENDHRYATCSGSPS